MDDGLCVCGHNADDHEAGRECAVAGCYCSAWEDDDE